MNGKINDFKDQDCLRWTFAELNEHVDALAIGLEHQLGLRKGDRVAILMGNSSAYLALQWALAKLGSIMVPLNPAFAPDELQRSLAHVQARALILVPSLKNVDYLDHLAKILPGLSSDRRPEPDTKVGAELLPHLEHLVLVDNLTSSPKPGWERTSVLARKGYKFEDALKMLSRVGAIDYRSLLHSPVDGIQAETAFPVLHSNKDIINLQLTSGTTGLPKAVALTSFGMLNNGIAIGSVLHLRPDDIVCNNPPLFHCFGLTLGNLATQTHGGCLLYASETFDPVRTLAAVSEEKATALHGVPAMFFSIMDALQSTRKQGKTTEGNNAWTALKLHEKIDISTLRTGLISGASIPVELMSRLLDELVPGLTSVYGMTETSPVSFGCDAVSAPVEKKAQTVGRVFPHVHAKIVRPLSGSTQDAATSLADEHDDEYNEDIELARPLPCNTPGELCTSGYLLMDGYYNDPERTREVMCEHRDEPGIVWMRTGDMAIMDEDGWVKIVGRCKDVIIRGGENLFPATICNCIDEVDGVGQSAVIAVPDERLGETVGVFIKRVDGGPDVQLLRTQIREHVMRRLSHQSAPEWIWILGEDGVEDELPKTASGKVQNVTLRAWARDLHSRGVGCVASRSRNQRSDPHAGS
ncbi:hypothetical protein A4X13_0g5951 [Tilletia indica]|uniref:AMP-dependent synthetase/ligase domain-containing protein n=1 Tax=Tilletia indica TaxID=43049 RepID=A0A177TI10_9BASI|nr:hypothetical protein A4X13_0g5951 [Tilletia indica]